MDLTGFSREQLIELIMELKMLNDELLSEKEREASLDFAWSGNLGHWYWNIKTNSVVFNPLKVTTLGYELGEIPTKVNFQFFTERLHPDDYKNTMDAMSRHLKGESEVYEVEYRIKTKDNNWKWFYDRGKITQRDEEGRPVFAAGIVFDITDKKRREFDLEEINEILSKESRIDSLTGVLNRRGILEELKIQAKQTLEGRFPLSIAMLDIDKFKNVNDVKGHTFGDTVLSEVAKCISEKIRDIDFVGRYGGEEFLIILPNTNHKNAISICQRIRKKIEIHNMGDDVKVTISGGIASYENDDLINFISRADEKLYEAKNSGRNKIL